MTTQFIRLFLVISIFFFSCNSNSSKDESISPVAAYKEIPSKQLNELKRKVVQSGDTIAYHELMSYYLTKNDVREFLIYALIMSESHAYPEAAFDIYFIVSNCLQNYGINESDSLTKKIGVEYLKKAARLGYRQAQLELVELNLDSTISK